MIPQIERREGSGGQSLSSADVARLVGEETQRWLRSEVREVVREVEAERAAFRKAGLLLGSAALIAPTAMTLLLLALILPIDTTQLVILRVAASVLFYAVVELVWRGRNAMPRPPLARLRRRFETDLGGPKAVVQ